MSQLKKLLSAHIEYELESWKNENLEKNLKIEVESFYEMICDLDLEFFIDKKTILDSANKHLNKKEIESEALDLVLSLSEKTHSLIGNNSEPLTSLLTKKIFEDSLNMGMDMKELRKDIIHTLTNSPVYTKMISSVLFTAIADFIGGENFVAKNVPGAFSLFKIGQDFLGNIPGVQAGIEKNLTAFIQSNLQNSLKQSEKLLNQELDSKTSKELTDELWNVISSKKISDLQHYANKDDIKKILDLSLSEWNHIKTSPLLFQLLQTHLDVILSKYKGKKIRELLALYKIEKSDLTENLFLVLKNYISKPEIQDYIKQRITSRLEGFYNSDMATKNLT